MNKSGLRVKNMDIKEFFQLNKNVAVAFSGGVDSAVLLLFAKQYAQSTEAFYVKSDFQPQFEYEDALSVAETLGVKLNVLTVDVLSDEDVTKNTPNRCYCCKKKIFATIIEAAKHNGFETVLDGTNASDDVFDRPGMRALGELGVLSPLRECGITKKDVRLIARENGLAVADKPSYACLATRIPTGTVITKQLLEKTEAAEDELRKLGFRNFRVRNLGNAAKLELGNGEFDLFYKNRDTAVKVLAPYYDEVYLDLKGRADE